jgi:hypothetical protein
MGFEASPHMLQKKALLLQKEGLAFLKDVYSFIILSTLTLSCDITLTL